MHMLAYIETPVDHTTRHTSITLARARMGCTWPYNMSHMIQDKAMLSQLKAVNSLTKSAQSQMSNALDAFADLQQSWDSGVNDYNKSLVEFNKEATKVR